MTEEPPSNEQREKPPAVRRTRPERRAIMAHFERSGQGQREFCEAEGLAPGTFSWWRRSFDGLLVTVRNDLGADPTDVSCFVFANRRPPILKVLAFDGDRWWVWSKRLESGRFAGIDGSGRPSSAGRRCARSLRARTSK